MIPVSRRKFLTCSMLGGSAVLASCGGGGAEAAAAAAQPVAVPLTPTAAPLPAPALPPAPTPTPAMPAAPAPVAEPVPVPASTLSWDIGERLSLVAGTESRVDLFDTLPADMPRNGSFSIDPGGSPLPSGVVLDPAGVLVVSATAPAGTTAGLVFAYIYA